MNKQQKTPFRPGCQRWQPGKYPISMVLRGYAPSHTIVPPYGTDAVK